MKRIVKAAKTTVTWAFLFAVPFALMAQPAPFDLDAQAGPSNVPAWTGEHAEQFPSCEKHREGVVAAAVVVVDSGADVHRMSVDKAYALNTDDERANNVWVIGSCA